MNIDQETLSSLLSRVSLSLPRLITAVVIFAIMLFLAGLVAKLIQRACNKRKLDREATLLLSRLGRYGTITLGIIWGLKQVNFDVTGFVAALGILGFTIGFALQDISKNFVAGILLLWQQPFNIGDTISVNGFTGAVMDISLRATDSTGSGSLPSVHSKRFGALTGLLASRPPTWPAMARASRRDLHRPGKSAASSCLPLQPVHRHPITGARDHIRELERDSAPAARCVPRRPRWGSTTRPTATATGPRHRRAQRLPGGSSTGVRANAAQAWAWA